MVETLAPVELFCSYAHEDEPWLRKLETHLSLLQRQGLISLWHDRLIVPGTNWARVIDTHLETASVILLLVSAAFFASDYCVGIEMKRALERQEEGSALVIPILVSEVNWREAPFARLQALPTDAQPLSTWSHEETALTNVAAGIRRAVEELPLLAASAPRAALPQVWNVPYPRNPFFLGRDTELVLLLHHLHAGQATALSQPQAISGLGGIGKTQLALEYAYRYHQNYQAVLWARAESAEALVSSYIALAALLRLPERDAREQDITVQAVKTWLQNHSGWLLILDNADELTLLRDFLPPSLGGHLLLTTRSATTGRLAHRLEIETLLPEQGALFLLRRAALLAPDATLEQASPQERELAVQISEELGGLPLALDQAGAYLEATGTDLTSYWLLYQQYRAALLRERRGLVADYPASVATAWSLSFQRVEEKNPAAADLLRMLAFLSPDAIPEEILTAGASSLGPMLALVAADALQLNQAIETLRAYSLVRRDPKEKTLSIHRLVQAVLQDMLEEAERHTWAKQTMMAITIAFPDREYGAWSQRERLLSHALLGAQYIERDQITSEEAGRLLHKIATYFLDRARYQEAELFYQRARRIWEQQPGLERPDMAKVQCGLANLYYDQGRFAEAEPLFLRAQAIFEQHLGPEHPDMVVSLNGLANVYAKQGKYSEAKPLYQRALRILEQQLGPDHPQIIHPLNGLAALYYEQGKYAEAEPFYRRALHINEQQLGPDHPLISYPLNNLAALYYEQGKYAEAELLYRRALHIREQQLEPDHPLVAYPLTGLANLYKEQGKYAEAELFYQRAQHIWEQKLGPDHLQVAIPLNNLAELYYEQGRYGEAEPLFLRAQAIFERQVGPDHPLVAHSLHDLALLYYKQRKYAEAESLYQRALRIREQTLGLQHSNTAETVYGIALLREAQGNSEGARDWYARALAICEQALGAQHPKTTETRTRLIALLHAMGQHEEAAQLAAAQSEL